MKMLTLSSTSQVSALKLPKRLKSLVGDNYIISKFADLPVPSQMAIVWTMAVDADAWGGEWIDDLIPDELSPDEPAFKDALVNILPVFIKKYGRKKFISSLIPTEKLKKSVFQDYGIAAHYNSWEDYAAWYASVDDIPHYSSENRWPVILLCDHDETVFDGLHRMHSYMNSGHLEIPAIYPL